MEPRSLKYVAESCAGVLLSGSGDAIASQVCTDSRKVEAGDLFVALSGERFDGHDFLRDVAQKGAVGALVEQGKVREWPFNCAGIAVNNARLALGQLAARYRQDFDLTVIAVGGSNGKTTTKELLASVLRQRFRTLWDEASFNNDIGVPMTLLRLDSSHQAAVLEAGTNHPGELAPLIRLIKPRLGVITSIGREHTEFFGDLDGVAEEEGWLAELLPDNGELFVNGESPLIDKIMRRTKAKVTRVGHGASRDWQIADVSPDESGTTFRVRTGNPELAGEYRVNLLGRHQAINASLAAAVGAGLGLNRQEIQRGLAECQPLKMRMQRWVADGVCILDDSYNANADSMIAALQTLKDFPCDGRRIAVLGDMAELGRLNVEAHGEVGRCAAEMQVDQLFAVGKMAEVMGAAARSAGLMKVTELGDVETTANAVRHFVQRGDVVLVKASRAARLERVVEALRTQC